MGATLGSGSCHVSDRHRDLSRREPPTVPSAGTLYSLHPSHGPGPEVSGRQLSRALHWNKPSQPIRVAESGHLSRLGRAIPGRKPLPLRGGVPQTVPTARRPPPPSQQTRPSGTRNANNPDGHGPWTRKHVYGMGRIISRPPGRGPYWRTSELPIGTYRYDYKLTCPPAYMNGRGEIEVAVR